LAFLALSSLWGCRYLGTMTTLRNDGALLATPDDSNPTRQPAVTARRCMVECGPGFVCNEALAECEPERVKSSGVGPRDAGVSWLP
jgi:hypothetical protein